MLYVSAACSFYQLRNLVSLRSGHLVQSVLYAISLISAGNRLMRNLNLPCTDEPHAPLADAFEVDDFLLDDVEQCCNFQVTNITNG